MDIKAVMFDADGTLLDSMGVWQYLCRQFLKTVGIEASADLEDQLTVLSLEQSAEYLAVNYNLSLTPDAIRAAIQADIQDFYQNRVQLKKGCLTVLEKLQANNIKMILVTATNRSLITYALKHTGIAKYFIDIVTCSEVGEGKDSPLIYETALKKLATDKSATIICEDAIQAVLTAKRAGFKTVGIYDPHQSKQDLMQRESSYYLRSWEDFDLDVLRKK